MPAGCRCRDCDHTRDFVQLMNARCDGGAECRTWHWMTPQNRTLETYVDCWSFDGRCCKSTNVSRHINQMFVGRHRRSIATKFCMAIGSCCSFDSLTSDSPIPTLAPLKFWGRKLSKFWRFTPTQSHCGPVVLTADKFSAHDFVNLGYSPYWMIPIWTTFIRNFLQSKI